MTKEEKKTLATINLALKRAGLRQRMEHHRFFPMKRTFEIDLGKKVLIFNTIFRELYFFVRAGDGPWGTAVDIGKYTGRGWMTRLASDVVKAVEKEAP